MAAQRYRYVFGPVASGRLGRSLGLDLLGARTCSMNCVYCESGRLTRLTLERRPYVPASDLLAELSAWDQARRAAGEPLPDVVTLGGLGEPTLNSDMPAIIAGIRRFFSEGKGPGVPVAVLTNASLMTDARVRAELAQADAVLPSLDSLVPEEFAAVNRGHPGLDCNAIAEGILAFRRDCQAAPEGSQARRVKLYLEVLLVAGVNDSPRNLELLAAFCNRLQPDRVDVTTLSRPGAETWAKPVAPEVLAAWRARLGGAGRNAEGPARLAHRREKGQGQGDGAPPRETGERSAHAEALVLASLSRRPQTAGQLAEALLLDRGTVDAALAGLLAEGRITVRRQGGQDFFQATA